MLVRSHYSFNHLIDLLRESAVDPNVTSINITLYRIAHHSKVVNALINAAKNGKQVIAHIELKARFDEINNMEYSRILQEEGVKVFHSSEEIKVHSKCILIERNEGNSTKGYVYIGTGNFNEDTTNIYSDFGYFTTNSKIVDEVRNLFDSLQNPHKHYTYEKLLVAPNFMRKQFENML